MLQRVLSLFIFIILFHISHIRTSLIYLPHWFDSDVLMLILTHLDLNYKNHLPPSPLYPHKKSLKSHTKKIQSHIQNGRDTSVSVINRKNLHAVSVRVICVAQALYILYWISDGLIFCIFIWMKHVHMSYLWDVPEIVFGPKSSHVACTRIWTFYFPEWIPVQEKSKTCTISEKSLALLTHSRNVAFEAQDIFSESFV